MVLYLEQIQRKTRVREWTPENAPRIRAGVTKKDQKAELKRTKRAGAMPKKTIFFQTTGSSRAGLERTNGRSDFAVRRLPLIFALE